MNATFASLIETPQASSCWGPSCLWKDLVDTYPPQVIDFFGTLLVQLIFFWLIGFIYLSLDYFAPEFSERHKIQPAPKQPTWADIRHCCILVARNQLVTATLQAASLAVGAKNGRPTPYRVDRELPGIIEFVTHFLACVFLRDLFFYYGHRALHHPSIYAKIHKQHHKFTAPVAISAQYAHPFEHVFSNVLPVTIPGRILGSHIVTFWAFLAFAVGGTATLHSGYDFFAGAARDHDEHHEKFVVHFGAIGFGFFDKFHGTDKIRREGDKEAKSK